MNAHQVHCYKLATRLQNLQLRVQRRDTLVSWAVREELEIVARKYNKYDLLIMYGRLLATPLRYTKKIKNLEVSIVTILNDIETPLVKEYTP